MRITLLSENSLRLEDSTEPLTIEAASERSYSPFHMVASGLATCTHSVVQSWATHAELHAHDLVVEVGWTFAKQPHRVGSYEIVLHWPSLPAPRRESAARAASLCAVHNTLTNPPHIEIRVDS